MVMPSVLARVLHPMTRAAMCRRSPLALLQREGLACRGEGEDVKQRGGSECVGGKKERERESESAVGP